MGLLHSALVVPISYNRQSCGQNNQGFVHMIWKSKLDLGLGKGSLATNQEANISSSKKLQKSENPQKSFNFQKDFSGFFDVSYVQYSPGRLGSILLWIQDSSHRSQSRSVTL